MSRRRKKLLNEKLIPLVAESWGEIRRAAARSLKKPVRGFLPEDPTQRVALGCGFWGCAWQTADPRFVIKASLDATEGPHVALAMKLFRKNPGLAYYHRLWRLPERVPTAEFGYTYVWIMLREEVDFSKQFTRSGNPARGYKKVASALNLLPECCSCLVYAQLDVDRGCPPEMLEEAEEDFRSLTNKLKGTPGLYVGKLLHDAWWKHHVLLGDVHFDNVGSRVHNLSKFGVKNHRKLVITDLGDWKQCPITTDKYPRVKVLDNPRPDPRWYAETAERIPVLA